VADKLRADIKGLTAEQLNDMMLEESNNFISTLLNENVAKAPEKNGPKWHVRKSRLERSGLTVTSLDELRKCDRSKVERLYLRGAKNITAQDLEGLTNIRALDLSETGIREIPSCVFKMKNLRWLWLARNPIKAVADDIRELRCLQYLNLDGTQVDKIPAGLTHLPSFHYLRMNGTPLDDGMYTDAKGEKRSSFIETLCCLKLKRFYARNTKITMLPRAGLSGQMTDLDVGGTLISEIPPEAEWIGRLRTISFAGCKKLKRLPENIDGWSKVLLIDLSDTPIAKDKDEIVRIRRAVGDKTTIIY
jgi:Leucine-rich repeat (LRR) protein